MQLPPGSRGHGTFSAYQTYGCRCETCKSFMRNYDKRYRDRHPNLVPQDHEGSVRFYNYGCRCEPCREARRSYDRDRWEAKQRQQQRNERKVP